MSTLVTKEPKSGEMTTITAGGIPIAACAACEYKEMNHLPDSHCYMFKDKPGEFCAQFRVTKSAIKYGAFACWVYETHGSGMEAQTVLDHYTQSGDYPQDFEDEYSSGIREDGSQPTRSSDFINDR